MEAGITFYVHSDRKGDVTVVAENNKIVLDLKGVVYRSSAGLHASIKTLQAAQKSGGRVKLTCAFEPVETRLRTDGAMEMLKMDSSVGDAEISF